MIEKAFLVKQFSAWQKQAIQNEGKRKDAGKDAFKTGDLLPYLT